MEHSVALPGGKIYSTPVSGKSHAGDLLAHEVVSDYQLPEGAKAVRIIYHSLDAEGHDVASSAAVLTPSGPRPKDGWPVIVWAHGTSGVAQPCAPSLMKDVYYGDEGLFELLQAGFALIAVDYHGLGTPGPHQYVNKIAQARDVIYSVPAARAAVPELGRRWVVDGHSQGGAAAWSTAEIESDLHDPDYLGGVSISGAQDLHALLAHMGNTPGVGFYLAFMAYGIHARYPDFKPEDMLTPAAMHEYANVTNQGCWYHGYASYLNVRSTDLLQPNWDQSPAIQTDIKENALARKPVRQPLLILAGEADATVPIAGVRELVDKVCRSSGPVIQFRSYPGLDHDPTMVKSVPDQIQWIRDRFAGKPVVSNCSSHS